ncbi:NUDIX hydrolase [Candidatus Microgenomates bacterium]|nr:NUDIX hydrolase [Candidatus Microgenomates bacterium]
MKRKTRAATVDGLIIKDNKLLLVKRGKEPYQGFWALPGGYVEWHETCEEAVVREISEETQLATQVKNIIGVYSAPSRSPHHTISIGYLLKILSGEIQKSEESSDIGWFPLDCLPPLAFDHKNIVDDYLEGIKNGK